MQRKEQQLQARRPFVSDPARIRRETRAEAPIGAAIEAAAEEVQARVFRTREGPPPTEAELTILKESPREPARLFTRVLVTDLEAGEQETYSLVPHDEADPAAGKVSIGSPLGRALLEEYPGAVVRVKAPAGERLYRILRVEA